MNPAPDKAPNPPGACRTSPGLISALVLGLGLALFLVLLLTYGPINTWTALSLDQAAGEICTSPPTTATPAVSAEPVAVAPSPAKPSPRP